jgi:hypothetical protein
VVLKGGTEFIFHHGIGGLLTLGQDYRSHDTNMWLEACMRGKPFMTTVIDTEFSPIVSELSVPRKTVELTTDDIGSSMMFTAIVSSTFTTLRT